MALILRRRMSLGRPIHMHVMMLKQLMMYRSQALSLKAVRVRKKNKKLPFHLFRHPHHLLLVQKLQVSVKIEADRAVSDDKIKVVVEAKLEKSQT